MFKVNDKDVIDIVLVSLSSLWNVFCFNISIVDFEQVNASWVVVCEKVFTDKEVQI